MHYKIPIVQWKITIIFGLCRLCGMPWDPWHQGSPSSPAVGTVALEERHVHTSTWEILQSNGHGGVNQIFRHTQLSDNRVLWCVVVIFVEKPNAWFSNGVLAYVLFKSFQGWQQLQSRKEHRTLQSNWIWRLAKVSRSQEILKLLLKVLAVYTNVW